MLKNPNTITNRPKPTPAWSVDALTDILKTVHLEGSLYYRSELTAPWGMSVPESTAAQFHVVRRGRCYLSIPDETREPLSMESGDLVLLSHGPRHALADSPATHPIPITDILSQVGRTFEDCHMPLRYGGPGAETHLICGYFEFESGHVHPLLAALPNLIVIRGEGGRPLPWLESILDLLSIEVDSRRPGTETVVNRLTETMLIQILRAYLATASEESASWLQGLKDPQIGQALGIIHRQPDESWTIDSLASTVGMSRSGFADRFRSLIGEPPMQYLTKWRMELAATHLRRSRRSLSEIAGMVGYQAEPAFSRVFKKLWGTSPGAYRRSTASSQ